jgi:hypothetical protein
MDDHSASFLREHSRDACSDAAAAPCDERTPSRDLKIHTPLLCDASRPIRAIGRFVGRVGSQARVWL